MDKNKVELDLLVETSWEVCNKVGGIYTVLSTKAKTLQKLYGERLMFIGPDLWDYEHPAADFKEVASLLKDWKRQLRLPEGVSVRTGRWLVPGRPIAILIKFAGMSVTRNADYGKMWEKYGVDSLHAYGDYDEGCDFGRACALVIENLRHFYAPAPDAKVIAHFNEWTTGMGLLMLKAIDPSIATIFTTHATCIGRSICGNNKPLYDYLKGYNGDQMAEELNMQSKHSLEKAAAHNADCFTTVSDVTAIECEQLLEIRPHVVTPNGFEDDFIPDDKHFEVVRNRARAQLRMVASALTGKKFGDGDTMIIATSGRCEYRNKGLDLFLDSMAELSTRKLRRKVLAFVMVPAWSKGPRADLRTRIKQKTRTPLPDPVVTHELVEAQHDAIKNRLSQLGIDNSGHTRVDVIYVPCYLNGHDGIFDNKYYDLLIGMDATVFPSYYEPWGYTPLESIAFGVPTITTSLSGFGQWVLRNHDNQFIAAGVNVIGRTDSNYAEVKFGIADALQYLNQSGPRDTAIIRKAAATTAGETAWQYFIKYYIDAFEVALRNVSKN